MSSKSNEQLLAENANLLGRLESTQAALEDAQGALDAIRRGEVDALVMAAGPKQRKVYTLEGADQPYRIFVEAMRQGAVTLSADGTVFYCNRRFAAMLKLPAERLVGHPFQVGLLQRIKPACTE